MVMGVTGNANLSVNIIGILLHFILLCIDVLCYMQDTLSFNTFSDSIMNNLSSIYHSSVIFIFDFVLDIVP